MFTASQLQFIQQQNRSVIRQIQEDIVFYKANKTLNDKAGNLELEQIFHNQLQYARRELKKWVFLQENTKANLRSVYDDARRKRMLAQIDNLIRVVTEASGEVVE